MTRSIFACTVACLTTVCLAADPKPRLDSDGFPLPAEAVQRFGSLRFLVNNLRAAVFSPDGKTVYTISGEDAGHWRFLETSPGLIAWEVPTGRKLWQTAVDRSLHHMTADPDGKSVWVTEDAPAEAAKDGGMNRVRYSSSDGKELGRVRVGYPAVTAVHPTGIVAWRGHIFSDTRTFAFQVVGRDGEITTTPQFDADKYDFVQSILLSPKADRLFIIAWGRDRKKSYSVAVDLAAEKVLWEKEWDGRAEWQLTPDGKRLVGCRQVAAEDKSRTQPPAACCWDSDTGKELGTLLKVPDLRDLTDMFEGDFDYILNGLVRVHPNGKTAFLRDKEERTVAIDLATWKIVPTKACLPRDAVLSSDGRTYLSRVGRHVVIHEKDTGRRLSPDEPGLSHTDHSVSLHFSATGERLVRDGGAYSPKVEWAVESAREVKRTEWEAVQAINRAVLSPDGKRKAVCEPQKIGWQLLLTNTERPKEPPVVLRVDKPEKGTGYSEMAFTPDARHLIGVHGEIGVHIWDVARGGEPNKGEFAKWIGKKSSDRPEMRLSPDGKHVVALEYNEYSGSGQFIFGSGEWTFGVYEVPSAKLVRRFKGEGHITAFGWTQHGRVVGALDTSPWPKPFAFDEPRTARKYQMFHLDPQSGQELLIPCEAEVRAWAVSPVGDTVAIGSSDGLRLYEASTGKLRHQFREQKRPVQLLAFSPDGRHLASESADGPVLLWDVRGDLTKPPKPDGWDKAWTALGDDGAQSAFQAVRLFALHPGDGVPELKKRFAELKPPSAEVIAGLVAKLGDADFQTRERAENELKAVGAAAFPALRKSADESASAEVKERAGRLLAVTASLDQLRAERAVEAVTLAGTDAAKQLLAEWAKGAEGNSLTKAAGRK